MATDILCSSSSIVSGRTPHPCIRSHPGMGRTRHQRTSGMGRTARTGRQCTAGIRRTERTGRQCTACMLGTACRQRNNLQSERTCRPGTRSKLRTARPGRTRMAFRVRRIPECIRQRCFATKRHTDTANSRTHRSRNCTTSENTPRSTTEAACRQVAATYCRPTAVASTLSRAGGGFDSHRIKVFLGEYEDFLACEHKTAFSKRNARQDFDLLHVTEHCPV